MNLYHVSYKNYGSNPILEPKIPKSRLPGEDEKIARISTAPRVADCLRMFPWQDYKQKVWVYRCKVPSNGRYPMRAEGKVPDWELGTREEYWLLKPMIFERIGRVRMFRILSIVRNGTLRFWSWTGNHDFSANERPDHDMYRLYGQPLVEARKMAVSMHIESRKFFRESKSFNKKVLAWR